MRRSLSWTYELSACLAVICVIISFLLSQLSNLLKGDLFIFTLYLLVPVAGVLLSLRAMWEYQNHLPPGNPIVAHITLHGSWILALLIIWNFLHPDRIYVTQPPCVSNQRQILVDCQIYAQDHDGRYPPNLSVLEIPLRNMGCPEWRKHHTGFGIGYNTAVRNRSLFNAEYPPYEIVVTADAKRDEITTRSDIDETRHLDTSGDYHWHFRRGHRFFTGFADGHVEMCKPGTNLRLSLPAGREAAAQ